MWRGSNRYDDVSPRFDLDVSDSLTVDAILSLRPICARCEKYLIIPSILRTMELATQPLGDVLVEISNRFGVNLDTLRNIVKNNTTWFKISEEPSGVNQVHPAPGRRNVMAHFDKCVLLACFDYLRKSVEFAGPIQSIPFVDVPEEEKKEDQLGLDSADEEEQQCAPKVSPKEVAALIANAIANSETARQYLASTTKIFLYFKGIISIIQIQSLTIKNYINAMIADRLHVFASSESFVADLIDSIDCSRYSYLYDYYESLADDSSILEHIFSEHVDALVTTHPPIILDAEVQLNDWTGLYEVAIPKKQLESFKRLWTRGVDQWNLLIQEMDAEEPVTTFFRLKGCGVKGLVRHVSEKVFMPKDDSEMEHLKTSREPIITQATIFECKLNPTDVKTPLPPVEVRLYLK
jgi:hypothetical protein